MRTALTILVLSIPISAFSQSATSAKKQPALAEAKSELARGDLEKAEATLWTALNIDPQNDQALVLLGQIRVRQNRFAEAEALFRRVLQIDPKSLSAHRNLAATFATEGKIPDATEEYKAACALAPQDITLKIELARLYVSQGQFEQAASMLQDVPASRFPPEAIPVKAATLVATGKQGDAIRLIESANTSPAIELQLAAVFLSANLPDETLHCLELASSNLKHRPALFFDLKGRALAAKGKTEQALAALRESQKEDPNSPDTLVALAEIYSSQNKHADAVAALKQAQTHDPDSLPILRHLVVEATKAGDTKAAVDAASALSDKSPGNPDDLYLAAAAMLQENVQGASMVLEKYVALRPDNAKAWMGLGMAYVQQEHYSEARKPLERAITIDPMLAEAEYQLGLVAKNEAKADEAIHHLQRAVQLQPTHAAALRTLGNFYLQSGELEKAKEALERAEAIDANNLQTEYDLGLVCNKLGQTELARQHMDQFRKLKEAESPADRHN
jgi:tetratricopeptide (TPR) repeat protein